MKRIIFLLAFLYGAALMAQNKAVAVTEVVDKQDKVSYVTEIMVRTRLTAAISMKQGYTAYDRVDLQSIMSEQNFQRTGLVDDATIKRLGEMTGASLILIPEVAMSDDGKIYVAVKMLDVTTAQTMMVTGQLMGSSSDAVEEGCRSLAMKILGEGSRTTNTTVSTTEPVTLFGYLHVFPTDIGEFQTLPAQLLSAINRQAQYGYDTWRLPTTEELSIMRANSHLIPNFKNVDYLCSDSSVKGLARLVTTGMSVAEKKEAKVQEKMIRKKAIFNLLDIHSDYEHYYIGDDVVLYAYKVNYSTYNEDFIDYIFSPRRPNSNFTLCTDVTYAREYANGCSDVGIIFLDELVQSLYDQYGATSRYKYSFSALTSDTRAIFDLDVIETRSSGRFVSNSYAFDSLWYLFKATLPSEELIQKEMQKIRSTLER
ncbi:MAG: hypothetical protein IJB05_01605 [Bacteroidales bacterium]|nr:hypothetical protein [Bacteroidales bacterium]